MPKSAQQRFNEYLAECQANTDAVNELVNQSFDRHRNYAHAAGVLCVILQEAMQGLPRARRAEIRERLYKVALDQKRAYLVDTLKQEAV